METAFFYIETDQPAKARTEISAISILLDKPLPALQNLPWTTPPDSDIRSRLAEMLKSLDPEQYAELYRQYYGTFAHIPSGTDTIGNEREGQMIVAVLPFQMAITETTWWQYNLFCAATGYPQPEKPGWGSDGDNPVVNVSWYDAALYCNWRSQRQSLRAVYNIDSLGQTRDEGWNVSFDSTANGFRLPMEAEWEYAARASANFEYAGDSLLQNVGWYSNNSGSRTHSVTTKKTNAFGLYDMSGNVMEWCNDWHDSYPNGPVKDYRGPHDGFSRTLRGGSWLNYNYICSVAWREYNDPWADEAFYGFRLAQD
ncbi:MAG: SUMF1/EgtB/PvdO family nonheme iron enzyme [Phycisphaerae bacterium]|nr:SUMF1/EgtB/PvdO family nonheme iron enzyme [Saprospiraceae bacterium]